MIYQYDNKHLWNKVYGIPVVSKKFKIDDLLIEAKLDLRGNLISRKSSVIKSYYLIIINRPIWLYLHEVLMLMKKFYILINYYLLYIH